MAQWMKIAKANKGEFDPQDPHRRDENQLLWVVLLTYRSVQPHPTHIHGERGEGETERKKNN